MFWNFEGKRINSEYNRKRVLKLNFIDISRGGIYTCFGSNNKGQDKFASSGILQVYGELDYFDQL